VGGGGGGGGGVEPPKLQEIRHHNMLTWPRNAGNPISEDLNFKNFFGEDAP